MPKEEKKVAGPSPSWFERMFGVNSQSGMTPNMLQGLEIARKEVPNLGAVSPYGPISSLFQGKAQGYASPAQTIYLNQGVLGNLPPQNIADTILHENQHVNQMKQRSGPLGPTGEFLGQVFRNVTPYGQRPDELEAFQVEKDRQSRMKRQPDIGLPSFSNPGQYNYKGNVYLPKEK